jgi:hypothetical protein
MRNPFKRKVEVLSFEPEPRPDITEHTWMCAYCDEVVVDQPEGFCSISCMVDHTNENEDPEVWGYDGDCK